MQRRMTMWMVCMVVGALAASPTAARADEAADAAAAEAALAKPKDPQALRHLEQGDAHFKIREFHEAIEAYRMGARLEASPRFLYNLAQSFRQLKDYDNALWYFKQWLNTAKPPDSMRLPIEEIMGKMRDEMAKAATTQPPTEPAGEGDLGAGAGGASGGTRVTAAAAPPWHADKLGWGLTAGGVVGAVAGALFLSSAAGLDDQADAAATDEEIRGDLRDKASTRKAIGVALLGVGGAVAITGVVRLILTPDGGSAETPPGATASSNGVDVTIGLGWVGLQGTF